MMRLVFLLSAEERGMLMLGEPLYEQNYAVSTMHKQLREQADQHAEEVLSLRFDAWSRLLALFRVVYGGIEYPDLRLPAYGGRLFDPDHYPFLEGRQTWHLAGAMCQPRPCSSTTARCCTCSTPCNTCRSGSRRLGRATPPLLPWPGHRANRPRLRGPAGSHSQTSKHNHPWPGWQLTIASQRPPWTSWSSRRKKVNRIAGLPGRAHGPQSSQHTEKPGPDLWRSRKSAAA